MTATLTSIIVALAAFGMLLRTGIADELALLMTFTWTAWIILSRAGLIDKITTNQTFIISLALALSIIPSIENGVPIFTTLLGFWQIWRSQIALILGIILLRYNSRIPNWPIGALLHANLLFSLVQPLLGESVMTLFYPAGLMEYRSGILRSVGFFANPGTNAFFIGLLLLKTWSDLLENPNSISSKAMLFITFAGLFITGSRTTILTCPILMIIMAIGHKPAITSISAKRQTNASKFKKHLPIYAFALIISIGLGSFLASRDDNSTSTGYSLIPNVDVISNTTNLSEGYFRTIATVKTLNQFTQNPLLGLGYGTFGTPASFSWPSPYLDAEGLIIEEDSRGLKLSQLDVLLPVILAESGLIGFFIWSLTLWKLVRHPLLMSFRRHYVFSAWIVLLLVATLSGPGLTHPIVIALLPFTISWILVQNSQQMQNKHCHEASK